jgi:hypothetical protein
LADAILCGVVGTIVSVGMNLDGRVFLLSLLLVPACTSRKAGDDDDDASRKLGDGCRALMDQYMACYEAEYDSEGYTYESTGYDSGGEYDPEKYCDYFIDYYREAYGKNCAIAIDDLYACLARQDCDELEDADVEERCGAEEQKVEKYCEIDD